MLQIVLAWKEHSRQSKPTVAYVGSCADEARKSLEKLSGKGFVRAEILSEPIGYPAAIPETAEELAARAKLEAETAAKAEELERAEKVRAAEARFKKAHDELHALKKT